MYNILRIELHFFHHYFLTLLLTQYEENLFIFDGMRAHVKRTERHSKERSNNNGPSWPTTHFP